MAKRTRTKTRKPSRPKGKRAKKHTAPEPALITGRDIKRIATCAANDPGRYAIHYVELSPAGLAATDGRLLCVLNAPDWPYHCFLEAKSVRAVPPEARFSVNGGIEFVSRGTGAVQSRLSIPHENPDQVHFPKWQNILPLACCLQPMATFRVAYLKRIITALQRDSESVVSLYARTDDCQGPVLLANEAGDLGLLAPVIADGDPMESFHFPSAIYRRHGLDTEIAPAAIPHSPKKNPEKDEAHRAESSGPSADLLLDSR